MKKNVYITIVFFIVLFLAPIILDYTVINCYHGFKSDIFIDSKKWINSILFLLVILYWIILLKHIEKPRIVVLILIIIFGVMSIYSSFLINADKCAFNSCASCVGRLPKTFE